MKFILYLITNTVTGQQYVGKTTRDIRTRWKEHLKDAKVNRHQYRLHRAIRKYGAGSFTVETIHTLAQDAASLNQWEVFYIEALRVAGKLYNMTTGGEGVSGIVPSAKSR